MTADGWVWVSLGLLLALLGSRAWVVETGHATLGRTPVKVKVLTGACAVAAALVVSAVTAGGGGYLVFLVSHRAQAQSLEDARKAADAAQQAAADAVNGGPDGTVAAPAPADTPTPTTTTPAPTTTARPKPAPV